MCRHAPLLDILKFLLLCIRALVSSFRFTRRCVGTDILVKTEEENHHGTNKDANAIDDREQKQLERVLEQKNRYHRVWATCFDADWSMQERHRWATNEKEEEAIIINNNSISSK